MPLLPFPLKKEIKPCYSVFSTWVSRCSYLKAKQIKNLCKKNASIIFWTVLNTLQSNSPPTMWYLIQSPVEDPPMEWILNSSILLHKELASVSCLENDHTNMKRKTPELIYSTGHFQLDLVWAKTKHFVSMDCVIAACEPFVLDMHGLTLHYPAATQIYIDTWHTRVPTIRTRS